MSMLDSRRVPQGGGRWGGRSTSLAGTRDLGLDENATEKRRRTENLGEFNGRQGEKRPKFETPTESPDLGARDGSRFEMRHDASDPDKPWCVIDSDEGKDKEKRFETQEDAENYVLKENAKELKKERDDRKEIKDASGRWGGRGSDRAGARDMATDPPVSEAQRKWAFANKDKGGSEGAAAKEFAEADPGGRLPARAKK